MIPTITLQLLAIFTLVYLFKIGTDNHPSPTASPKPRLDKIDDEAISALVSLGFRKTQARHAVTEALYANPLLDTEELIKAALVKI